VTAYAAMCEILLITIFMSVGYNNDHQ